MLRNNAVILSTFAFVIALGPSIARADEPSPESATQDVEHPCGGPEMHGPLGIAHAALKESIGLSSEQRTAIETSLASLRPPAHADAVHASHRGALAAQIRAGVIDETALAFHEPTSEERTAHEVAAAAAITRLHDTLTAEQRTALVTAMLAKRAGGPPPEARAHHDGGPMHLFEGLGLTDAQETAVRTVFDSGLPDAATMRARFDAMRVEHEAKLRGFAQSAFDAHAFLALPTNAPRPEGGPNRMINDLKAVVPLLTNAQREALAQRIEAGPTHGEPSAT